MFGAEVNPDDGKKAVFGGAGNEDGGVDEIAPGKSFEEALEADETSVKKEMGKEGYKEVLKAVKEFEDDPFMLNVKVQDMSDTLILRAFGRVRDGK